MKNNLKQFKTIELFKNKCKNFLRMLEKCTITRVIL